MEIRELSEKVRAGRHVRPERRRGRLLLTVAATLAMLAAATTVAAYAVSSGPETYSFFLHTDVSGAQPAPGDRPVELGLRFVSREAGTLTAVRFLKARGDHGAHPVTVWSGTGRKLASATAPSRSHSGWQQVKLPHPVTVEPGIEYVVSYQTSRFAATPRYFAGHTATAGPLSTVGSGTFAYGSGFPTQTSDASNYWVDVVVAKRRAPVPAPPSTTVTSPVPTPGSAAPTTAPPTASASAGAPPAGGDGLDLARVPWEGGPSYYTKFAKASAAGWDKPSFFPIGVWYESVLSQADIDKDKAAGLNTYVELTDDSDMPLISRNGMHAMTSTVRKASGGETTGWLINDEVDMWGGAGKGTWSGKYPGQAMPCTSGKYDCGYDVMKRLSSALPANDGRMMYANFGKGVMFWQDDADASRFVNNYTSVVSDDIYWYTDPDVCEGSEGPTMGISTTATCRRSANYGLTMDRLRTLDAMDGKRQPVYAFVEVGHPFTKADAPTITADQIGGAVMNSLIHEARGILYFNHNFSGPCISQHVLRDACGAAVRPAVSDLNHRITSLAPVLNTQSYQWVFNTQLDTMLKAYDGSYYVFAMPGRSGGTGRQQLTLPKGVGASSAEVLFEKRSVPITDGVLTDSFDRESSYHIYKITP